MIVVIKEKYSVGREPRTSTVRNYVSSYQSRRYGAAESAQETADHSLEVLGQLIECLMKNGILTVEELEQIKEGYVSGVVSLP